MEKKVSGIIVGTPNESEFSNSKVNSEKDNPIILKIYGKEVDIDIDLDGNVFMTNINSLIERGKELVQEFNSSDETYKEDKNVKCLRFFLEALNQMSLTTKQLLISTKISTIIAEEKMELLSKEVKLGSLEDLDNINTQDEENKEYDFVLSHKKFNRWWKNKIKPFISKITELENKYNFHTHSGTVPPPFGEDAIRNYQSVNTQASGSEAIVSSKTVKVI